MRLKVFYFLASITLLPLLIISANNNNSSQKNNLLNYHKQRVIVSSDIGGTDPDDNQSMIHFLMYSNMFKTEGLISSPSYGHGSKQIILNMIDLYAKDYPKLKQHSKDYPSPDYLRSITKQGRRGGAPYAGFTSATEGSNWIIKCAEKKNDQPLYILVWGGLDDLAQALHDSPDIQKKIRIYWIGGPNKKWSANSYAYIAKNFPSLWFIEVNSSYRGFFSDKDAPDSLKDDNYYDRYIRGAGYLGKAFKNYYNGNIKMGDTPSVLYMMSGDPDNPLTDSWGGSFMKINHSPRIIFHRNTTISDTVPVYSILEFHFKGPKINIPPDSSCFTMNVYAGIGEQKWEGYYLGQGNYAVRYAPKKAETLTYQLSSDIPGLQKQSGKFVVDDIWPGKSRSTDYKFGPNWYTDSSAPSLLDGIWQGAKTVQKWRTDALMDWAKRWEWLKVR